MSTPLRERPDAPLGTLIFRAGLLPAETIESALEEGVKTGKRLGEILTERGLLKEADLARLLAGQKGLEFVTLREQIVDTAAASLFSEDQARLFRALPYAFEDGTPVIAIADPSDEVLTRNIREALGREDAKFVVSVRSELGEIIGQVYSGDLAAPPPPEPEVYVPQPEAEAEAPQFDVPAPEPAEVPAPMAEAPVAPPEAPAPAAETPAAAPPSVPVAAEPPVHPAPEATPVQDTTGSDPGHVDSSPVGAPYAQNGSGAPEHVELQPPVEHAPEPVPQPVAPPVVETPQAVAAAEPVAAPEPVVEQPVPTFQVPAPEPAPEPAPAAIPEPSPTPEAAPSSEAPALAVSPPPATTGSDPGQIAGGQATAQPATYRLSVRLMNGERVEAGAHDELEAAKQQAKTLMAQVAAADGGDWPFVNGRFIKPDTIVSVDIL